MDVNAEENPLRAEQRREPAGARDPRTSSDQKHEHSDDRGSEPSSVLNRVTWVGLLVLASFPLFGAVADLVSDQHGGIPRDHYAAFRALSGMTVGQAKSAAPGLVQYVHQLEVGYAVHELVFAVLLLGIVAVPLRQCQRWAWFACWTVLIADITYAATFGAHDSTILLESIVGALGMSTLLLAFAPSIFSGHRSEQKLQLREVG